MQFSWRIYGPRFRGGVSKSKMWYPLLEKWFHNGPKSANRFLFHDMGSPFMKCSSWKIHGLRFRSGQSPKSEMWSPIPEKWFQCGPQISNTVSVSWNAVTDWEMQFSWRIYGPRIRSGVSKSEMWYPLLKKWFLCGPKSAIGFRFMKCGPRLRNAVFM